MKTWHWIGVRLVAAICAGPAAAYSSAGFWGTVMDGTPDYSEKAFAPLDEVLPKLNGDPNNLELMRSYETALVGLMQPNSPIGGCRVVLRSDTEDSSEREVTTDNQGKFRFENLMIGEYTLAVHTPGEGRQRAKEIVWRLKVEDDYRGLRGELVVPSEFVTAKGTVVDSAGRPLAGIQITGEEFNYNGESSHWPPVAHVVKTVTDKKGRYILPGLHPARLYPSYGMQGQYVVRAEGEGFAPREQLITAVTKETHAAQQRWWKALWSAAPAEERERRETLKWPAPADARGVLSGVDFTMTSASGVGGCVQDQPGNPIPKAYLSLEPGDDVPKAIYPLPGYSKGTYVGESGRFAFDGLVPGHYRVKATAAGYVAREIPLELAEGQMLEVPVGMDRAGTVLMDVTRNGKREVPQYMVTEGGECRIFWSGTTNAAGICVFDGLPPGKNRLRVGFTKEECERYEMAWASIASDQTNEVETAVDGECAFDLDLSFPPGGAARVWVDPADAPVEDDLGKDENRKAGRWVKYPGRFSFAALPAGEYRISLQHFESAKEMKFDVPWKAERTQTIRLTPGERPAVAFEF
jgi:hypothetical protein